MPHSAIVGGGSGRRSGSRTRLVSLMKRLATPVAFLRKVTSGISPIHDAGASVCSVGLGKSLTYAGERTSGAHYGPGVRAHKGDHTDKMGQDAIPDKGCRKSWPRYIRLTQITRP